MQAIGSTGAKAGIWTGRSLSAMAALFMLFDSVTKLLRLAPVVQASAQLGYSADLITVIGVVLLACVIVYVTPRTAVLGAVLLTGYLGGAVASNLRIGTPLATNVLFPAYVGVLVWTGLFFRDARLRALLPVRTMGRE